MLMLRLQSLLPPIPPIKLHPPPPPTQPPLPLHPILLPNLPPRSPSAPPISSAPAPILRTSANKPNSKNSKQSRSPATPPWRSSSLSAYPDQLSPLKKSITKTIHNLGLERINSEPGIEFNPDLHEAVSVTDEGGDREVIAATLRPGYLYEGSVLRPTMVQVKRVAK